MFKEEWLAHAERLGHVLKRDEDGCIDIWVTDSGFHNGPGCESCGHSWCYHCTPSSALRQCQGGLAERIEASERAELARLKAKYKEDS